MRFRGSGIGHVVSREWNELLQANRQSIKQDKNLTFHSNQANRTHGDRGGEADEQDEQWDG
jgi:hypothetical protein